jgi:hypothetical protein
MIGDDEVPTEYICLRFPLQQNRILMFNGSDHYCSVVAEEGIFILALSSSSNNY